MLKANEILNRLIITADEDILDPSEPEEEATVEINTEKLQDLRMELESLISDVDDPFEDIEGSEVKPPMKYPEHEIKELSPEQVPSGAFYLGWENPSLPPLYEDVRTPEEAADVWATGEEAREHHERLTMQKLKEQLNK